MCVSVNEFVHLRSVPEEAEEGALDSLVIVNLLM